MRTQLTSLKHEPSYVAMKVGAIVIATCAQSQKVFGSLWDLPGGEIDRVIEEPRHQQGTSIQGKTLGANTALLLDED